MKSFIVLFFKSFANIYGILKCKIISLCLRFSSVLLRTRRNPNLLQSKWNPFKQGYRETLHNRIQFFFLNRKLDKSKYFNYKDHYLAFEVVCKASLWQSSNCTTIYNDNIAILKCIWCCNKALLESLIMLNGSVYIAQFLCLMLIENYKLSLKSCLPIPELSGSLSTIIVFWTLPHLFMFTFLFLSD